MTDHFVVIARFHLWEMSLTERPHLDVGPGTGCGSSTSMLRSRHFRISPSVAMIPSRAKAFRACRRISFSAFRMPDS